MFNHEILRAIRSDAEYEIKIDVACPIDRLRDLPEWAKGQDGRLKNDVSYARILFRKIGAPCFIPVELYFRKNDPLLKRLSELSPYDQALAILAKRISRILKRVKYPDFDRWHYLYFSDIDPNNPNEQASYNALRLEHYRLLADASLFENMMGSDWEIIKKYFNQEPLVHDRFYLSPPVDDIPSLHVKECLLLLLIARISIYDDGQTHPIKNPYVEALQKWRSQDAPLVKFYSESHEEKHERPTEQDIDEFLDYYFINIGGDAEMWRKCLAKYLLNPGNSKTTRQHLLYMEYSNSELYNKALHFIQDGALFDIYQIIKDSLHNVSVNSIIKNNVREAHEKYETVPAVFNKLIESIPGLTCDQRYLAKHMYLRNERNESMAVDFYALVDDLIGVHYGAS